MKLTYNVSKCDRSRTETQDGLEKRPLYTVTVKIWSWAEGLLSWNLSCDYNCMGFGETVSLQVSQFFLSYIYVCVMLSVVCVSLWGQLRELFYKMQRILVSFFI